MRLQSFAEIGHAYAGVNNGDDEEYDSDDRECGQGLAGRSIVADAVWRAVVHAYKLEDEVCEADEV